MVSTKNSVQLILPTAHAAKGFTLIEALISMFIFSWIGLASYQMLDQVVLSQEINKKSSKVLANMQRVSWQLSRDFRQMVSRPITDELGDEIATIVVDGESNLIEFTRTGWVNPLKWPRSDLQRVAYRIDYHPESNDSDSEFYKDDALYLIREYWQVLDRAIDSEPKQQAMMRGVLDFYTRYWDHDNKEWSDKLIFAPVTAGIDADIYGKPYAIEVTIVMETDEVWVFVFQLV